jgi:2-polyprenyl-3-methyl-5-hydroxy-6-metoxy-1,4-benzoquinol methylase
MSVDEGYTLDDHEFRDDDLYAAAKYDITLRWLHERRAGGVLANVGCGGGVFNARAIDAGFTVRAFEPDPAAYALAAASCPSGCTVAQVGLFDIDEDLVVDVAVMHDVLEHIDGEAAAVSRLAQMVRPGGLAVVSVPALESLFGYHDVQLGHFRRYTRTTLARALRAQFEVEELRYFGLSMVPVAWWFSRHRSQPYPKSDLGQSSLQQAVMKRLFDIEARVSAPIGTSVLALARRR